MKLLLIILLTFFASVVESCETFGADKNEWLKSSSAAYYGRIVSISLTDDYDNVHDLPLAFPGDTFESLRIQSAIVSRYIKVLVLKTIKGTPQESLDIRLEWCDGGETGFLDFATIYNMGGYWHVKPDLETKREPISAEQP